MKLSVHDELVPPHIDGFAVQSDFRFSRFSAVGLPLTQPPQRALDSRAELELNLVLHGQAHILMGEQRVTLERQHMLWIRPRQNRLVLDVSDNFRAWVLVFKPRVLRRVLTTDGSAPLKQTGARDVLLRRLAQPEVNALSALFASLPAGQGRDVFNAGLGYALARSWLAHVGAAPLALTAEVHPAVREAAWLLRDGHTELGNAELASRVGLSAHRLSRLFKKQMGTSLVDFRNRQRLERFLRELGDGEAHSLLRLALDAGFGSYTQFHRVFHRTFGCSPAEYQKRRRLVARHAEPVPSPRRVLAR